MSLLALQDLFRLHREKATGVWKLGQDPSRTVFLDYGDTVFAQSTHLADRLTTILVERGRITQAQMDYALANLKPGISIGKNLIEMGFITQRDLLDVAKLQVERIIHGCMAQADAMPAFESRELDAHVVRLPLNTPQLLLGGMLAIQDRGSLLELLGPLNQVVVLQGKSLMDLSLPPDLGRLTTLLDGTHTLLELGREAQAEPLRVGAFALFLREMGWARLHEMPPLDRQALESALAGDPEPLSPPLAEAAEAPGEPSASLFNTIQEAARPTTNLEHLSQALDEEPIPEPAPPEPVLPEPEPLYLPEGLTVPGLAEEPEPTLHVETGHADLPTPSVELPPLPEPEPEAEPVPEPPAPLRVHLEPDPEPEPAPAEEAGAAPRSGLYKWVALAAVVVVCLVAGFLVLRRRHPAPTPPAPPATSKPAPEPDRIRPEGAPSIAVPPQAAPTEAAKPEEAKPEPRPEPVKAVAAALPDRLEALRKGDLDKASAQGAQHVKESKPDHWALRLEIACQGDTIRRVQDLFKDEKPDLFLLPMTLRDGRICYQILYGDYPTKDAAEKGSKRLPAAFGADRDRPKAFKFSEIPKEQ